MIVRVPSCFTGCLPSSTGGRLGQEHVDEWGEEEEQEEEKEQEDEEEEEKGDKQDDKEEVCFGGAPGESDDTVDWPGHDV
eukprot:3431491-Pyramimonas_sp.AAC.1